ncbi:MAG: hypothetical protein ACD_58C00146G0001 [uncultured bacterium]|nr:MAG: hypothetical protein ACD_58C00146G0001 [uncultured bacterium]
MKSKNSILIAVIIVLVIVVGYFMSKQYNWFNKNKYTAAYLQTGELYFGEKVGMAGFNLKNAWLLNKGEDGKYSLQEFSQAAWKPVGAMHLAKDKVVFWTNIDENSDIAKLIKGEKKSSDVQPSTTSTESSTTTNK